MLFLKFCEPQNLENRDFSRRKLSVIQGMAISDNEEKAFFQDFEAGSDSTPTANHNLFKNTNISKSWNTGVEFNPPDGSKGDAVKFIKQILPDIHTSVAIGDCENDYLMLKAADIPAAVGDGTEEIKRLAKHITVDAKDGAVADLIYKIESEIKAGNTGV